MYCPSAHEQGGTHFQLQLAPTLKHQARAIMSIMDRYGWQIFSIITGKIAGHRNFDQARKIHWWHIFSIGTQLHNISLLFTLNRFFASCYLTSLKASREKRLLTLWRWRIQWMTLPQLPEPSPGYFCSTARRKRQWKYSKLPHFTAWRAKTMCGSRRKRW